MVERIPMDKTRTLSYQSTSQENGAGAGVGAGAGAGRSGVSRATRSMDDEIIDYSDEELSMVPRPVKKPERIRRTAICRDAPLDLKLGKRGRRQEVDELSDRLRTSRVSDAAAAAAEGGAKLPSLPTLSSPPAYDDSVISGYKKSQHHEHEERSRSDGESYGWIATSFESRQQPVDLLLRMVPLKKLRTNF